MSQQTDSGSQKPDITDKHKESAKEVTKVYTDGRQTTTLPGSGGTVSGTVVADWVDPKDVGHVESSVEEGDVEYRNSEEFRKKLDE